MGRTGTLVLRWLVMTCSVKPRQAGAVDADNRPVIAYGTAVTGIPCRLAELDERLIASAQEAGIVGVEKQLLVAGTVAIRPADQVIDIRKPDPANPGSFLAPDPGPYIVRQVLDGDDRTQTRIRTAVLARAGGAR